MNEGINEQQETAEVEEESSWGIPSVEDFDICELNIEFERTHELAQQTIWNDFNYAL